MQTKKKGRKKKLDTELSLHSILPVYEVLRGDTHKIVGYIQIPYFYSKTALGNFMSLLKAGEVEITDGVMAKADEMLSIGFWLKIDDQSLAKILRNGSSEQQNYYKYKLSANEKSYNKMTLAHLPLLQKALKVYETYMNFSKSQLLVGIEKLENIERAKKTAAALVYSA